MRKITIILKLNLLTAFVLFSVQSKAVEVFSIKENFLTDPGSNWGFTTVSGHTFGYDATNKAFTVRVGNPTSYTTKVLTASIEQGVDNKIKIEMILKCYTAGASSNSISLYFLDSNNKAIFGIGIVRNSSQYRLARLTNFPGLVQPTAIPSFTDALATDQPLAKVTVVLDMTNKTLTYYAVAGTFDTTSRVFTAASPSITNNSVAFIDNTAGTNISKFLSNYFRGASDSGTRGYDLYYMGISTEQNVQTQAVTINYLDENGENCKTPYTTTEQAINSNYTATVSDKTSFSSEGFYYAYDAAATAANALHGGTGDSVNVKTDNYIINLRFQKSPSFNSMTWNGTTDQNGNIWAELTYKNFINGTTSVGSQQGSALIFNADAANKNVMVNDAVLLGSSVATVSAPDYTFTGNGSLNGSGSLNVNLNSGDALTLGVTNNLPGTIITGGNVTITKTGVLGSALNISGATVLLPNANNITIPSTTVTGTTTEINAGNFTGTILNGLNVSSGNKAVLKGAYNTSNANNTFAITTSGSLASGSELELNGTGTVENKFGLSSASTTYFANTKITLRGKAFLFINTNQGSATTINVGTLAGESGTKLGWGGSTAFDRDITWSVGARNESSEFAGTLTNVGAYLGGGNMYMGNYTNLNKVGAGVLTLSGISTSYNGNLSINGGELLITGSIKGNNSPSGSYSTYTWGPKPNTVTVANAAKLTVSGNLTATNFNINTGGEVVVTPGKKLTLDGGTFTNNGAFSLLSDNENGTATFVNNGNAVNVSATVNQYLSTARNWYISAPIEGATAPSGSTYYYYDETQKIEDADGDHWIPATAGTTLVVGKGYIAQPEAASTLTFYGTLNDGNKSITLTRQGATSKGFNLVGNPYPSYLDAAALLSYNRPEGAEKVENNIWYRTRIGSAYQFQTYNASGDESVPQAANASYIHPMQSFWVRATADNVELNFTNAMRKHNETVSPILLRTKATSERQRLRLQVNNGSTIDEALIYFDANASNAFDRYDAPKFAEKNTVTQIFSTVGTEKLVINGMNSILLDCPINIGFVPGNATTFSITANEVTNLPSDIRVILKDNANGIETDLTDGVTSYQFAPSTTTGDRFSIIFRSSGAITGIESSDNTNLSIFINGKGQITVKGAKSGSLLSVYNSIGQKLLTRKLNNDIIVLNRSFTPGVYIVSVDNVTRKLIIE